MDVNLEVKPTFTLPASSLQCCVAGWNMASQDYHMNIRYGQHICNWFSLNKLNGEDDLLFEQRLWEMNDLQLVTDMLLTVIDWSN